MSGPVAALGRNLVRGLRSAYARRAAELSQKKKPLPPPPLSSSGHGAGRPSPLRGAASLAALPGPASTSPAASAFRFLVHSVLRRVTTAQSAFLRRRTAQQLFAGRSAPFLALVGVSLASGNGIVTKDDEVECVCSEIRQAARKIQWQREREKEAAPAPVPETAPEGEKGLTLADFRFGSLIAKGCNAAVYAARWTKEKAEQISDGFERIEGVAEAPKKEKEEKEPLAIKMMFNYEAESNSLAILNSMRRETLPARFVYSAEEIGEWCKPREKPLPPHPNVVDMKVVFTDYVPDLSGAMTAYPDALPRRINPDGFGRNMSLFLVMKRYDTSLKAYLAEAAGQLSARTSLLLLTQLLEGVAHLTNEGVAHRDLKTDNLLLTLNSGSGEYPSLVITDFGCCLADDRNGLRQPYPSLDVDRGGNVALMAPEVAAAQPGAFATINYEKADLWAAGAIAYEIFGAENPFYGHRGRRRLDSRTYRMKDLPGLPEDVPPVFAALVQDMLERNPSQRLSAEMAATICQLLLWAPGTWYKEELVGSKGRPGRQDVLQWLLTLTTKVLCESRFSNTGKAMLEYKLVATFLARLNLNVVTAALDWIRNNY